MENEDFLELFYSNLKTEIDNDEFVNSIEKLINTNEFTKDNYMKLLLEEYHE